MHDAIIEFIADNHIKTQWTSHQDGKPQMTAKFDLKRKSASQQAANGVAKSEPAAHASAGPPASESLGKLRFLAGAWSGDMNGDLVEEHWTEPSGDALTGMFRWVAKDGRTRLYEILSIKADPEGPTLRLRHFDGSFTPWKSEADAIAALRLTEHEATRAVFTNVDSDGGLKSVEYATKAGQELTITVAFQDPARQPRGFT